MKPLTTIAAVLLQTFVSVADAADNPAPAAKAVTRTFYISGVECVSCVDVICRSVSELSGVKDIVLTQGFGSYANVTFDPNTVSEHQIAQAVRDAPGLHGRPYETALHLLIPSYLRADAARKIETVFAKYKEWMTAEITDKAKGEFSLVFKPLATDDTGKGCQGFTLATLTKDLGSAEPAGLGIQFSLETEGLDGVK